MDLMVLEGVPTVFSGCKHAEKSYAELPSDYLWWMVREFEGIRHKGFALQTLLMRGEAEVEASSIAGLGGLQVKGSGHFGQQEWLGLPPNQRLVEAVLKSQETGKYVTDSAGSPTRINPDRPVESDVSDLGVVEFPVWLPSRVEELFPGDFAVLREVGEENPHEILFREAVANGTRDSEGVRYLGVHWKFTVRERKTVAGETRITTVEVVAR